MNIVCVICSESLLPSEAIFYTPCGHTFHFPCLTKWLERSKTCPQCREKVSQQKIHRLYFNYSSNDSVVEDSTTLQSRVESLEYKLLSKEKDLKHCTSKATDSEKKICNLQQEMMRLETELKSKITFIENLKLDLLYSTQKQKAQRKTIKKLREDYSSLKREMKILKRKVLNSKKLEEELAVSQTERVKLERRLKVIQGKEPISIEVDESVFVVDDDSDNVPVAKKRKAASKSHYLLGSPIVVRGDSSDEGGSVELSENKENPPYLQLRSTGISAPKEVYIQRSNVGGSNSNSRNKKIANLPTAQKAFEPNLPKPGLVPAMITRQKSTASQNAVNAKKVR